MNEYWLKNFFGNPNFSDHSLRSLAWQFSKTWRIHTVISWINWQAKTIQSSKKKIFRECHVSFVLSRLNLIVIKSIKIIFVYHFFIQKILIWSANYRTISFIPSKNEDSIRSWYSYASLLLSYPRIINNLSAQFGRWIDIRTTR